MFAQRFSARALLKVVRLDIVPFSAVRVVVVDILLDLMPRICFRHVVNSVFGWPLDESLTC